MDCSSSWPSGTPILPWYYLGDLFGLIRAEPTCGGSTLGSTLIDQLIALSDTDLEATLKTETGTGGGDPPLIAMVRAIVDANRTDYPWTRPWPSSVKVRIRRIPDPLAGEMILGPDILVLPWSDDGFPIVARDKREAFREKIGEAGIDFGEVQEREPGGSAAYDYDPATAVYTNATMHAADKLLTTVPGRGYLVSRKGTSAEARGALDDWAGPVLDHPVPPLPSSLEVTVHDSLRTDCTYVEVASSYLHLHMGWDDSASKAKGILFQKWPCGAFGT